MIRAHDLTRLVAAALAVGAVAAPAASALPDELRSAATRDAPPYEPPSVDLRSPDAKDAAIQARQSDATRVQRSEATSLDARSPDARDAGRATATQPAVRPASAVTSDQGGLDWGDVGIGAGGAMTLVGIGLGLLVLLRRRIRIERSGAPAVSS